MKLKKMFKVFSIISVEEVLKTALKFMVFFTHYKKIVLHPSWLLMQRRIVKQLRRRAKN